MKNKPETPKVTLKKLTLENFKNFQKAELELGPFTVLVGANAIGKSNLREAFRFLHGIGRGYTLAEVIGEKYVGGERVWQGIRGGLSEVAYQHQKTFVLNIDFYSQGTDLVSYSVNIDLDGKIGPWIVREILSYDKKVLFDWENPKWEYLKPDSSQQRIVIPMLALARKGILFSDPELFEDKNDNLLSEITQTAVNIFQNMRFFDFHPSALRLASLPGQTALGDQGENLSSVLYAICQDKKRKESLASWLEALTPMEVVDFEFPADQIGRILVTLVEKNGQKISAYSASDGTLRLLAILAAFLGPESAKLYFFEELENGIHPTRLHLLTGFIEDQTAKGNIQVIASTHSPHLLNFLRPSTLEHASLLYRLPGRPDAHIQRIMDIPDAKRLIQEQGILPLHESGWFENVMYLLDDEEEPEIEVAA